MKNTISCLLVACTLVLMTSCGGKHNAADDKLGKLEIEIPAELMDHKDVVEFIQGMNEVTDEYALMIDNTMEDVGEYVGVDESELGMMDKIKLVKATTEIAVKSTTIMAKWSQYMENRSELNQQLSDDELKALETVWTRFEKRMEQINENYSKISNKDSEQP